MISLSDFKFSKKYLVNSLDELYKLAKSIREKNNDFIEIDVNLNKDIYSRFKFPFSNFLIKFIDNYKIYYDLYAKKLDEKGKELTTWKTATFIITGNNNIFINLNVSNSKKNSPKYGQEVALAIYGDNNLFIDSTFTSEQDTLFIGPLPDDLITRYIDFMEDDERYFEGNATNYFYNCNISGTVDFIFGAGKAIFYKCNLITLKDERKITYVVAPAHSLKDDFGFYFESCNFINKTESNSNTYLARPWRDYGKVVISNCNYQDHIKKEGFSDWSDVYRENTCRFFEFPLKKGRVNFVKNKQNDTLPDKYLISLKDLIRSVNH